MNHYGNIERLFEEVKEYWSPKIITEVNEEYVKIAKIKGELVWHSHEHEDEMFYVVKGSFEMQMENESVMLNKGDFYVVPKNVLHNPYAKAECWVMLIEKKETKHTGNIITPKTRSIEEQFL